MCDKAILGNAGTLKSVSDCYKDQEMSSKVVEKYSNALEFVPESYETQEMCDKFVSAYSSTIKFVPECIMTQEMCNKAVIDSFLYLILFVTNMKLKKYVIVLFLKIVF